MEGCTREGKGRDDKNWSWEGDEMHVEGGSIDGSKKGRKRKEKGVSDLWRLQGGGMKDGEKWMQSVKERKWGKEGKIDLGDEKRVIDERLKEIKPEHLHNTFEEYYKGKETQY